MAEGDQRHSGAGGELPSAAERAFLNPVVIVVSLLLAIPIAGFGCGVLICSDCGDNPADYAFIGAVHAVLSTIALGHCWSSAGSSTSLWLYIRGAALFVWFVTGSVRLLLAR